MTDGGSRAGSTSRLRWAVHVALLVGYVTWIGVAGLGREADAEPALGSGAGELLRACLLELALFAAVLGTALFVSRASRRELLLFDPRPWRAIPLGIGYSLALRLALAIVVGGVLIVLVGLGAIRLDELEGLATRAAPDTGAVVDAAALLGDPAYYWLSLTLVSFVLAGLREELWRAAMLAGLAGLWPGTFSTRVGRYGAVALAALVFGFGHAGMGWSAVVATTLIGLGLGAILVFHRSIWPAVIAHGCFDAASLALLAWVEGRG